MAWKFEDEELVYPHEFMMANGIQADAVTQLLIEKASSRKRSSIKS